MSTEIYEKIKETRRLTRMRLGQDAPSLKTIPSTEHGENGAVRVAIVPLVEKEYDQALIAAADLSSPENAYGAEIRDRWLNVNMLFHALRNPHDVDQRAFGSPDELSDALEGADINFLTQEYRALTEYSSPALDGLGEEEMEELKKALEKINLNALSGRAWWHLKEFFMTLMVDQLQGNSSGNFSIRNLIGKSEPEESTLGVEES